MAISLPPNRLQRAEHYCVQYCVPLPDDVTVDQAMAPEFWAHVGRQLKRWDIIILLSEAENSRTETVVTSAGPGFAALKILSTVSLDADERADSTTPIDIFVKYNGPHDKWTAIRKSDGEKLKTGFTAKVDAEKWLSDHVAALNR
jgi:hypothetical protein